ncbi:MAG: hypothetical protein Q4D07_09855 [Selenomonadaceae bacterium]|nr:hypothetical protein [Selenomonadaceae bacterium]
MKNMKKLTCQILAACALTTGIMLVNGGLAYAGTQEASNKEVISDPDVLYDNANPIYGGNVELAKDEPGNEGTANNNILKILNSANEFTQSVLAGGNVEIKYTGTGTAAGNLLTIEDGIEDGVFKGALHGGHVEIGKVSSAKAYSANTATANGNTLNIKAGEHHGDIAGGYVDTKGGTAQANNNILKITGGEFISYNNVHISGGWARSIEGSSCVAQANGNKVEISDITMEVRFSPAVKGSDGKYKGDGFLSRSIYGGYATSYTGGTATANENKLTISGALTNIVLMPHATINYPDKGYSESVIYAGNALNGTTNEANNNTLTIKGGKINGYSIAALENKHGTDSSTDYGGTYFAYIADPNYTVKMDDTTDIGGGLASNGTANNNKVIISGGTIGNSSSIDGGRINVYGGKAGKLVKGNEVIINQADGTVTITGDVSGGYSEPGIV